MPFDAASRWTDERDAQLCALAAAGLPGGKIAEQLEIGRNAVLGRIHRLRALGDPRLPPAGPGWGAMADFRAQKAARAGLPLIDQLAQVMADGCPTLPAAAKRLHLPRADAVHLWDKILAGLGRQAR